MGIIQIVADTKLPLSPLVDHLDGVPVLDAEQAVVQVVDKPDHLPPPITIPLHLPFGTGHRSVTLCPGCQKAHGKDPCHAAKQDADNKPYDIHSFLLLIL